jgi:hypothetical protein
MIEQGFYKDVQDYIDSCTRMEIRIMKRQDADKKNALLQGKGNAWNQ